MSLQNGLDRIQEVRFTESPSAYIKARIAQAAKELSLAGDMALHVAIANEALCKVTALLYETAGDNWLCNVDSVTSRILVVVPWGSKGFASWGLRKWESDVLRSILIARSGQREPRPALFDYSPELRTWFLATDSYGNLALAQRFLAKEPVTVDLWRAHYDGWKQQQCSEHAAYRQRRDSKAPAQAQPELRHSTANAQQHTR